MALAERAELIARLSLKDDFSGPLGHIKKSVGGLQSALESPRLATAGRNLGFGIAAGVATATAGIGVLAKEIGDGLRQLVELERLGAQTEAVLKSTGGAAGVTAEQVRGLAEKFESLNATIDDKVIQNTENLLLTFTSIKKEAFEPALQAILDMNSAMGGGEEGLQTTVIQVGKALQDPIKGITALRKVGVNFSADQIKVIKSLVETGDVLGAQKLILKELNTEFGGSFLAQGNTTAGKVAKVQDSFEDLQKALATAFLPVLGNVADKLSTFLADPATVKGISDLGDSIAGIFSKENIDAGAKVLGDTFAAIKDALPGLQDAAKTIGGVIGTAVGLFQKLPPDLQRLAIGALAVNKLTGGAVTSIVGSLAGIALSSLKTITAAQVTVVGGTVTGGGAGGAATAAAGGGAALVAAAAAPAAALIVTSLLADEFNRNAPAAGVSGTLQPLFNPFDFPALLHNAQALAEVAGKILTEQQTGNRTLAAIGLDDQRRGEREGAAYDTLTRNSRSTIEHLEELRLQKPPLVTVNVATTVKSNIFGTTATNTVYSRYNSSNGAVVV